jgi:membrane associated rhomboid family serine protease
MSANLFLLAMIAANCLFSYQGFQDTNFFRKYEFHIGSILSGEKYRMFTSSFLHADLMHLVFNMYTLYLFAPVVLSYLGGIGFLIVYLISLFGGSLLSYIFHKNEYNYRAIGASGAVTGIVYSAILLQPSMEIWFLPAYVFGIGYLLYSIYGMKAKNDNIGHTAHFGGAIGGYVYTLISEPSILVNQTNIVLLLAIPIAILFAMSKTGKL